MNETAKIPTFPNGGLPDAIFTKNNRNLTKRCRYYNNELRTAYVLVLFTKFEGHIQSDDGGGIQITNCDFRCTNTIFKDCVASNGGGGAIYIKNSINIDNRVLLQNVHISNCKAVFGGAVYVYSNNDFSDVLIQSCSFISNDVIITENPYIKNRGGSALFLTIKIGNVNDCTFKAGNVKSGLIKVNDKFDEEYLAMKLLGHLNNASIIKFDSCIFDRKENSIVFDEDEKNHFNSKYIRIQINSCNFEKEPIIKSMYKKVYQKTNIILLLGKILCISFLSSFFIFLLIKKKIIMNESIY